MNFAGNTCMELFKAIDEAVSRIHSNESRRLKFFDSISFLKEKNLSEFNSIELLEESLAYPVNLKEFSGRIAGIDSGFIGQNFSSMDLILVRAMAAIFNYVNGSLAKADYFPNFFKFPDPIILTDSLERDEFNCSKSLHRLREEVSLSRKVIEKFKPEFLFIDGSIVPQHADKPRSDSSINKLYGEVLSCFQSLYESAEKNNCELIACVEDSRGTRFSALLQKEILNSLKVDSHLLDNCFDSVLLDYFLEKGERRFCFSYSSKKEKHPILNDMHEKWSEKIHCFYLKPSKYDRPLRVEFLSSKEELKEKAERISETVLALSSLNREYAYPSILIEADLRARLKPEEINIVVDNLINKAGRQFFIQQRRDKRPF